MAELNLPSDDLHPLPSSSTMIGQQFCFVPERTTIKQTGEALRLYEERLDRASNLEGDTPIFLDANVLLNYYKISFTERAELLKFFEKNKARIHLTNQIEREFLRNRVDHIRSYLKAVEEFLSSYRNIKSEIERLKTGEIKGFEHYLKSNNILKNDFPKLRDELADFHETLKKKLVELFEEHDFSNEVDAKEKAVAEFKKTLEGQADIERNDPLLDITSEFTVVEDLSTDEKEFLTSLFDQLNARYQGVKNDQNHNWKHTFPGCGEKKEYPYGDFFIFHEILKFMRSQSKGVIFLTNDVEKNDWLLRKNADLLPYTHYIVNTFIATQQTLHVFQAKDKIRVSYQPAYAEKNDDDAQFDRVDAYDFDDLTTADSRSIGDDDDAIDFGAILEQFEQERYYPRRQFYPHFRHITDDEFLYELSQSQKWARDYGNNFVGLRSFIVKYLGGKDYDYKSSYRTKDRLVEKGLVEIYTHKSPNSNFSDVEAIRLAEGSPKK